MFLIALLTLLAFFLIGVGIGWVFWGNRKSV